MIPPLNHAISVTYLYQEKGFPSPLSLRCPKPGALGREGSKGGTGNSFAAKPNNDDFSGVKLFWRCPNVCKKSITMVSNASCAHLVVGDRSNFVAPLGR